jgi:stage II sporulation protein E
MSSFIKRDWEVKEIKSSSLPAGILEKIQVSSESIQLEPDDFVIMITDGILDSKPEVENKEEWFIQLLKNSSFDKAQAFSEYIMEKITEDKSSFNDDMTLIVFKVFSKLRPCR